MKVFQFASKLRSISIYSPAPQYDIEELVVLRFLGSLNNFIIQGGNVMFTGKVRLFFIVGVVASVCTTSAIAKDDPAVTCSSAAGLIKEGDVAGALEEARWCVTQLEQMMQEQESSLFPDEIDGYIAGKVQKEQAMGISMIEREYSKDNTVISVSLTGGGSGGPGNPFAAIAQMGLQMGGMGQKIRIQKRSAVILNEDNSSQVIVTLKSGGTLTFESRGTPSETVVAFAKKFPVAELDDSRY